MSAAYTAADWERDWEAAHKLACPRCGSDEDFGPRQAVLADRTFRRYRACKRCGLCQEADGQSLPYQTIAVAHECTARVPPGLQCRSCGKRPRSGASHLCARILRENEAYTCPECGTVIAERHHLPWANPGPWK